MKLDDISLGEPVNAALVLIDGVHTLVCSHRAAKADGRQGRRARGVPPVAKFTAPRRRRGRSQRIGRAQALTARGGRKRPPLFGD